MAFATNPPSTLPSGRCGEAQANLDFLGKRLQGTVQEKSPPCHDLPLIADSLLTRTGVRQAALRLARLVGSSLILQPIADKTPMTVPILGFLPFESAL